MLKVFIDIETLPPARDKWKGIGPDLEQDEKEYRKLALNGNYGQILCIGIAAERDGKRIAETVLGFDEEREEFTLDEKEMLEKFWYLMKNFNPARDIIIGHNIFDFDLLFIYKRSIIHGVNPQLNLSFARYRSQPIFDTMREWEQWGRKFISLAELGKVLDLDKGKLNGLNGSKVFDLYTEGEYKEIARYCRADVELTRDVYNRMNFIEAPDLKQANGAVSSADLGLRV